MERILIFGNTHESREAAQTMRRRGKQVIVCVTTEYARAQLPPGTMCHIGRFDDGQMLSYIRQTNPRKVIDATHPYATATQTRIRRSAEQLGIPVVFVEAKLEDYGAAYKVLGELLGMEDRGNELSAYCTQAYDKVESTMATIPESERVNMAYLLGENGLNAIAKTSFQGQVIDMVANNVVVVDDVSGKGSGNEISLEQIALWDPELVIFQKGSIYESVGDDSAWQGIAAIANDNYYEVPNNPWCWMKNPPTVNQLMGMQWLPRLLYPDAFDDSIQDVTRAYYHTMYGYDLTDAELSELLEGALPKVG